jgi:hypothetical protein
MPQPPHFEEVALEKLIIDPGYQRELIEPHLKKIATTSRRLSLACWR